jgi:hypothetical protein
LGKIENTILMVIMVSIISLVAFFGFIGTSSSTNDTNTTNSTNTTNIANVATASSSAVTAAADPTPSASGTNPSVSLSVNSPANLGTVVADGSEYSYPKEANVTASANETTYILQSNTDKLNLYVKASGDLISPSDSIPLSNLKYDGFSTSKTSFTTDYVEVESWRFSSTWVPLFYLSWSASGSVNGNYYLTVPTGVAGETYTTTIYYLAIIQ